MRLMVILALVGTLGACQVLPVSSNNIASVQQTNNRSDVAANPQGRGDVELDTVPFFPDDTTLCGPSALAAVLSHAGIPATVEELTADVYLPGRQGSLQLEMLTAVRRRGAVPMRVHGGLPEIEQALRNGFAPLVLMNLGLGFAPSWHYAVVVGIRTDSDGARTVILRSGTERRQQMTAGVFERVWARSARWALIVATAGHLPVWMPSSQVLDDIVALKSAVDPPVRINLLHAARQQWPTDQRIAFALAAQLQAAGQVDEAQALWLALATTGRQPAAAANLASLLMSRGETEQAARWACEALRDMAEEPLSATVRQTISDEAARIRQLAGKPACGASGQAQTD